jgi:hypothetical protein
LLARTSFGVSEVAFGVTAANTGEKRDTHMEINKTGIIFFRLMIKVLGCLNNLYKCKGIFFLFRPCS